MKRPFMNLAIFFVLGVLAAPLFSFEPLFVFLTGVVFCILGVLLRALNRPGVTHILFILAIILGVLVYDIRREEYKTPLLEAQGKVITLRGSVCQEPVVNEEQQTIILEVEALVAEGNLVGTGGRVQVTVRNPGPNLSYGDMVEATGILERPHEPTNPGQFNYRAFLERKGLLLVMKVEGSGIVQFEGQGNYNPLLKGLLEFKRAMIRVNEQTLAKEDAALINGMIFGAKGMIDREVKEAFVRTGLIHILTVSGLHVGLVLAACLGVTGIIGLSQRKKAVISGFAVAAYGAMTGFSPPVLRAVVMALTVLGAKFLGREKDWPNALALAAVVILFFSPGALFDAGFQLSFAATWGILYLTPLLERGLSFFSRGIRLMVAVPLAAQLATIPLVAYYFNLVSLIAIPANILLMELAGLMVYLGFAASLGGFFWLPLAGALNVSQGYLVSFFLWVADWLNQIPGGTFYLSAPPAWLIVLWYLLLGAVGANFSSGPFNLRLKRIWRDYHKNVSMVLIVLTLLVGQAMVWPAKESLRITFLDVGNGDCALIQTPQGKNLLIDTGGSPAYLKSRRDVGRDVVVPFLRRQGIKKLDALILTHGHDDHFGGAAALLDNFPVGLVLISPDKEGGEDYQGLIHQIKDRGIILEEAGRGDRLTLDPNLSILFLSPPKNLYRGTSSDLNNNSLVLKLTYGKRSFLFTADIEEETIEKLLDNPGALAADLLKVPHHGSRTSVNTVFYDFVKPSLAVIPVGKNNFGHPAPEVLKELTAAGATVLRTDQDGAIIVETDGEELKITTARKDLLPEAANQ